MQLPEPEKRTLFFTKDVDLDSISELTQAIIRINKSDEYLKKRYKLEGVKYTPEPIEIFIDSYGGYVYQCFGLLSVMERSKTPIHTIVTGCAMSCGYMMLICGHKRFAHKRSTPMYHQVSGGAWGKVKDVQERYKEMQRLQDELEKMTLEKTKIPEKKVKKIFKKKKDWFMTAQEALEYGVVDEILD